MHKRRIFIIIAVLAALILTGGSSYYLGTKSQQKQPEAVAAEVVEPQASSAVDFQPIDPNNIFELVNAERVKAGVKPLVRDARLDASAKAKCDDMVARNYYAHDDPDGQKAWHYFTENGYSYSAAGENLAKLSTAVSTVSGWMDSESHKANILAERYQDTGIAVCKYGILTVQHFGTR